MQVVGVMEGGPLEVQDISGVLGPGVFMLLRADRVVYVGKAKVLLLALANYAIRNRKEYPDWFPVPAIKFDAVRIVRCNTNTARQLHNQLVDFYNPIHNRLSKPIAIPNPDDPTYQPMRRI